MDIKMQYQNYHRDTDYQKFEPMFHNIFMKRFNLINRYIKKGKVLDIGCSIGIFLDIYKENGWETWGVEPSKSAQSAKRKGHRIIKDYFENLPAGRQGQLPKNYFDLVILNHTLEHMDNPTEVLLKVSNILKKKGIVFIDVPNAGGIGAQILGKHWPFLAPEEHKWQFTKDSLEKILVKAGFKVIHFESRSGLFEYAHPVLELWQALTSFKKRFFTDILTMPYSLFATLFNMGDSMSLIGKKD
jgi:2-polyprenyl-3-methyl-5-hydroxy-6-metoxy-1,4-benzoquinol methylase